MTVDARWPLLGALAGAALAGCAEPGPAPIVGALEWDRIAVTAELAEPVLSWAVAEGDRVAAGTVLLELDARRQDARIAEARSQVAVAEAQLAELTHGARVETIDAARANLARARAAQQDAETDVNRARAYAQQLLARAEGDAASFDKIYAEYRLAPEVTRRRLYYETMESVLANTDKTIVEADGVTPYLPLPELRRRAQQNPAPAAPAGGQ